MPVLPGQAGAQNSNAGNNQLASGLATALGVLSIAVGALNIARSSQQLQCCTQGCNNGAGERSRQDQNNIQQRANGAARGVSCPKPWARTLAYQLVFPAEAEANLGSSGCIDALIGMGTGALLIGMGVMGLMAAQQANNNSSVSGLNAANLGSTRAPVAPGYVATSPTPASSSGTNRASLGSAASAKPLDPRFLRTGSAGQVMNDFEKEFGIPRENLAQSVMAGMKPEDILANAPRNPISPTVMAKAKQSAGSMSADQQSRALAGTGLNAVQKEMISAFAPKEEYAMSGAGGRSLASADPAKKEPAPAVPSLADLMPKDDLGPALVTTDAEIPGADVSAKVAATEALAALADPKDPESLWSRVHTRYKSVQKRALVAAGI